MNKFQWIVCLPFKVAHKFLSSKIQPVLSSRSFLQIFLPDLLEKIFCHSKYFVDVAAIMPPCDEKGSGSCHVLSVRERERDLEVNQKQTTYGRGREYSSSSTPSFDWFWHYVAKCPSGLALAWIMEKNFSWSVRKQFVQIARQRDGWMDGAKKKKRSGRRKRRGVGEGRGEERSGRRKRRGVGGKRLLSQ